jgi:hypothetical protein
MLETRLPVAAALCALVVTTFSSMSPATADDVRKRSLARCTSFDQRETESALELTIKNSCTMPIDCTVSWQLVCAPESRKRRKITPGQMAFTLSSDAVQSTAASAEACGDDSWIIKNVLWRCEASKE